MNIKISIYRFTVGDKVPHYDTYDIPFRKGMTLLDAVLYVQQHVDSTLGFRYECRQGICGTCGMMLNKKPVLACSTELFHSAKALVIDPLANFPVERDLIVNLAPVLDRYMKIKPYLDQYKDVMLTRVKANESKPYRKCVECGCCIAGSSTVKSLGEEVADPMALVKIARYLTDPREGLDRTNMAKHAGAEKYSKEESKLLAEVCPRGVPIDKAVKMLTK